MDYCHNQDYVGNPSSHLHCGKSFLTLSRSSSQHDNLQGRCNKIDEILRDPKYFYSGIKEITAVLQGAGCLALRNVLLSLVQGDEDVLYQPVNINN